MAVSLDGVIVPMKNGGRKLNEHRQPRRESTREDRPATNGRARVHGAIVFQQFVFFEEGDATIRMARIPEVRMKATLKVTLEGEQLHRRERSDLKVVKPFGEPEIEGAP